MVTGMFPFTADNLVELNQAICLGKPVYPSHLSDNCRDLLRGLLIVNVDKRLSIGQVLKHKWISWVKFNRPP